MGAPGGTQLPERGVLSQASSVYPAVVVSSLSHVGLCDPHGLYSLPGSSLHGIFHARLLEWVVISFCHPACAETAHPWGP